MRNAWNNAKHLIECDVARTTSSSSVKSPRGPKAKPAASRRLGVVAQYLGNRESSLGNSGMEQRARADGPLGTLGVCNVLLVVSVSAEGGVPGGLFTGMVNKR